MQIQNNLKWIHHNRHPFYTYYLQRQDKNLLTMRFDYRKSVYTAHCQGETGEAFVIDRIGFWKSKIVLLENNIPIGKLYAKNWYSNAGIAEIKGATLHYQMINNPLAEIQFLHQDHVLSATGIKPYKNSIEIGITTVSHFDNHPFALYILALSWYMLLPVVQEHIMEFSL